MNHHPHEQRVASVTASWVLFGIVLSLAWSLDRFGVVETLGGVAAVAGSWPSLASMLRSVRRSGPIGVRSRAC